jgi:hypothetical protein
MDLKDHSVAVVAVGLAIRELEEVAGSSLSGRFQPIPHNFWKGD